MHTYVIFHVYSYISYKLYKNIMAAKGDSPPLSIRLQEDLMIHGVQMNVSMRYLGLDLGFDVGW